MKITIERKLTNEDVDDIVAAGFDSGISYWCSQLEVKDNDYKGANFTSEVLTRGGSVILQYEDGEDTETQELTIEKLEKGIQMAVDAGMWDGDDVCDVDSDVADNIIQFAIFGELVYG